MPAELLEEAQSVVRDAVGDCHEHPGNAPEESVWKRVIAARRWCACMMAEGTCNTYCDSYGAALIELQDGRFFVATEWSDTSGHG